MSADLVDPLSPEYETALVECLFHHPPLARKLFRANLKARYFRQPEHKKIVGALEEIHTQHQGVLPDRRALLGLSAVAVKKAVTTGDNHREVDRIIRASVTAEHVEYVRSKVKDWMEGITVDTAFGPDSKMFHAEATRKDQIEVLKATIKAFEDLNKPLEHNWHTPAKALETVGEVPRTDYPCWVPELEDKYGIRIVEGTTWMNSGSTGRGKSLYQVAIVAFYVWAGIPVVAIDYENDEADFWLDLANALHGLAKTECPSDLSPKGAIEYVRATAEQKCGRADGIVFVSFEDELASDADVRSSIESIEEETGLFYPIVCVDALGDMTSEMLEQSLRSEWSAQRRMIMRLTAWIKRTHRVLFGTLQTNRQGEKDQRDGKEPGIDTQGGGIAFAKKAKVYCAITDSGLKVLKFRRAGHLRKKLLPFEYIRTTICGNQRGYVRPRVPEDLESDAKWGACVQRIRDALMRKQPLEHTIEGKPSVMPLDYATVEGLAVVQAAHLQVWVQTVATHLGLKRLSLIADLEQRAIIEKRDDLSVGGKTRTYYFLRCQS